MKISKILPALILSLLCSACFVCTFHPLYFKSDLFANSILLGEWVDSDSVVWRFNFISKPIGNNETRNDSTGYILTIREKDKDWINKSMEVRLIKLDNYYFADFSLSNYLDDVDVDLFDLHLMGVHTFAKVTISDSVIFLNWFSQEWFINRLKERKIRIKHEESESGILVTASTRKLQSFALKYADDDIAFEDGYSVELTRIKPE